MSRAKSSGIRLTNEDASIIKGMLERGDRQHDVAAWFGVNSGRIAEISNRKTFAEVRACNSELPPSGPYPNGRQTYAIEKRLKELSDALENAQSALFHVVAKS